MPLPVLIFRKVYFLAFLRKVIKNKKHLKILTLKNVYFLEFVV